MTGTLSPLRVGRVTASRLPAVLGISPHTTREAVLREMVREYFHAEREFVGNIATDWGKQFEPQIIAEYELTTGEKLAGYGPFQMTWVHPSYGFLAATPDACTNTRVVECKAPWKARWTSLSDRPDYEAQLRMQMDVSGRNRGDLAVWRQGQPLSITTITYDADWLPSILPRIEEFVFEYSETIADPVLYGPHLEPLKDERTDDEWAWAAADWLELDFLIKQLEGQRDTAAEALKQLAPEKSARGAGLDLLRYSRKGNVQYSRAFAELLPGVDLESYRGRSTDVVSIRRVGKKGE